MDADASIARRLKHAMDENVPSNTTRKPELQRPTEPEQTLGLLDPNWRHNPTTLEFNGRIAFNTEFPSSHGQTFFTLTANTVDADAKEYLGNHYCHSLAAAMHHMTGWDIVTIDRMVNGELLPVHSAVRTPAGDLLDIFGRIDLEAAKVRSRAVSHRVVAVDRMPGDVVTGSDHLRGNPHWWAAESPVEIVAVYSHFARHVLRSNGYAHLVGG
ncbi:hypothetical protein [Nocardia sp. NBC_00403]|uniref:hypothetical protein n=1 Tax=Nocardia sp. NBC_00403 TaxID=2975990 RepID=UPI002E1FBD5E